MIEPRESRHRRGSVLIIMMGISLIIVGLILTLSVKTKKSLTDSALIAKHAQAHLMFQGALMYLSAPYLRTAVPPAKNCWDITSKAPESPPDSNRSAGFTLIGGVCNNLATASNNPLLATSGWYYIAWDNTSTTYFIVTAGGGSKGRDSSTPALRAKRYYDVVYYMTLNPTTRIWSGPTWPSTTSTPPWPTSDPKLWP